MSGGFQNVFFTMQGITLIAVLVAIFFFRRSRETRHFRTREDQSGPEPLKTTKNQPDPFWNQKVSKKSPLSLPGIQLEGRPHEILGVPSNASAEQIQKAYRDLMKRYHPDKVGRSGSPEWHQAQKIAEIINRAKADLLKSAQSESSNRSGR